MDQKANTPTTVYSSKSDFVTFLGILMGFFAVYGLLSGLFQQLFLLDKVANTSSVDLLKGVGLHGTWLTPENLNSILHFSTVVFMLFNIVCLWASVSLYRRKAWSRTFFNLYFTGLIIRDIAILLMMAMINISDIGLLQHQRNNYIILFMQSMFGGYFIANGVIYAYCLYMLTSLKIKQEFQSV